MWEAVMMCILYPGRGRAVVVFCVFACGYSLASVMIISTDFTTCLLGWNNFFFVHDLEEIIRIFTHGNALRVVIFMLGPL